MHNLGHILRRLVMSTCTQTGLYVHEITRLDAELDHETILLDAYTRVGSWHPAHILCC